MDLHDLVGSYRNVIVIGLCEFVRTAVATLYIPFWTLFLLDLGASVVDIGLLSLVTAVIILLFQLPVAYLGDAFGKKRIIVLCSACLSVGY
jgi:MFS family permease